MARKFEFNCLSTGIGSMPEMPVNEAISLIKRYLSLPHWPQLPMRANFENMYIQFSEGFPGISINGTKISVEKSGNFDSRLENFYTNDADNNTETYKISPDYAMGLYSFKATGPYAEPVKGQLTGPISWGLSVTDAEGRGIIYDDLLAETIAKFLHLKAAWEEKFLRSIAPDAVIFVDEPYLASLGSEGLKGAPVNA